MWSDGSRARFSKGAQIWSLDMVFATLAFVTVLLVVLSTNSSVDERIRLKEDSFYQESVAQSIAQNLVATPGYWYLQAENSTSVGLAKQANVLDPMRVSSFFAADYNETLQGLGMGKWDLRVRLYDKNGALLGTFGSAPLPTSKIKIVNRLCVYDGNPARLRVEVWE